jgi:hypothetical protein
MKLGSQEEFNKTFLNLFLRTRLCSKFSKSFKRLVNKKTFDLKEIEFLLKMEPKAFSQLPTSV